MKRKLSSTDADEIKRMWIKIPAGMTIFVHSFPGLTHTNPDSGSLVAKQLAEGKAIRCYCVKYPGSFI